jgi:hypothetical protein
MRAKLNGASKAKGRYSPAESTGIKKTPIAGKPEQKHISHSTFRFCFAPTDAIALQKATAE